MAKPVSREKWWRKHNPPKDFAANRAEERRNDRTIKRIARAMNDLSEVYGGQMIYIPIKRTGRRR